MCGMKYSEVLSHRLEVVYTHVFMPSLKLCRVEKKGRKKKETRLRASREQMETVRQRRKKGKTIYILRSL